MCVQGIKKNDKHGHILIARKESEILRNAIRLSAKQAIYRQSSNTTEWNNKSAWSKEPGIGAYDDVNCGTQGSRHLRKPVTFRF
jgi:hypothetical protein